MGSLFATGDELVGEVLGIVYADPGTGFGVVEIAPDSGTDPHGARCAGPLADLVEGQTVRLVGSWRDHPRYGMTFEATFYEQTVPTTVAGLRNFLLSPRFEIAERTVDRILTVFGDQAGWVIERDHERLVAEGGVDPDVAQRIHERWRQGRAYAALVRLVEPVGLPQAVVRAAFGHLGVDAAEILREDPYALLEVRRARFAHADGLARHLGVGPLDPRRLAAGARAAHAAARRDEGHQYLERSQVVQRAGALLRIDPVAAADGVDLAVGAGDLVAEVHGSRTALYTPAGLAAETNLANELLRILGASRTRPGALRGRVEPSDELTDGQRRAVLGVFSSPLSVITGGPGTGKTRTIEEIVRVAEEEGLQIALCAPTGRAAKRMEELVGRGATTVHRLLEAKPAPEGGFTFRYGSGERLPHDLVICDEVSMCDTSLAAALVSAVDDGSHLVLVGDPDQLPSVGPGDVLRDLLRCELVPTTRLVEVHRQAATSRIVRLATELNAGVVSPLPGVDGDVFMAEEPDRRRIVPRVVHAVSERIPAYFEGVTPADIQVVAPVYRGEAGVDALNAALKVALNPPQGGPEVAGFEVGDRVMQTRNAPELDAWNGDIGHVVDVDRGEGLLRVALPRGEVVYTASDASDLTYAWATTVHKSQGGEWPVVVFVCDRSHRGMLWRNLAYTAVTRAQRALVIVGQREALSDAARHDQPRERRTRLAERMEEGRR